MNIQRSRALSTLGLMLAAMAISAGVTVATATAQVVGPRRAAAPIRVPHISSNRVTFYQVPLVCPVAPSIGCGSDAKPVLLALERMPVISQAWLNRTGTRIAIVWKQGVSSASRKETLQSFADRQLPLQEISDTDRPAALRSFREGAGWYRGAAVDQLSAMEADIVASRFVRRMQARTTLTAEQRRTLEAGIADFVRRRLVAGPDKPPMTEADRLTAERRLASRAHLDEHARIALQQAVALGARPQPGEK